MNERSDANRKGHLSEEELKQQDWAKTRAGLTKLPNLLATLKQIVTGSSSNNLPLLSLEEVAEAIAKDSYLLKDVRDFLSPNGEGYLLNKEAAGQYKQRLAPLVLAGSAKKPLVEKKKKK
jgi:hypothetical protein